MEPAGDKMKGEGTGGGCGESASQIKFILARTQLSAELTQRCRIF